MALSALVFNGSPNPTIGVEVELQTINSENLQPVSGAPELLKEFKDVIWLKKELLNSIVEVNTDICKDVAQVRDDLGGKLSKVIDFASTLGLELLSMGIHPLMNWKDASVTDDPRYNSFLEKMQWVIKNFIITGLHVHVGVDSGEKAIAITNGLTRYIPHFLAISASSPFHDGEVTGLASTRAKIFEALPTGGIPHRLLNYSEFQKYMRTLQKAKTIESIREVWWDFRPHIGFGTVEIRICDNVPTLEEIVQIAAFSQCLVVAFSEHYDNATQLPLLDRWILAENKWRAIRYGLEADIIVDDTGTTQPLKIAILETIDILVPVSKKLGCQSELMELCEMVHGNRAPYIRQLETFNKEENLKQVIRNVVDEMKESVSGY